MKNNTNDEETQRKVSFFKRRGFRFGSLATVFTILFVAIIIGVNIGVSWLSGKYPISVDMTANKTYKVSAQTLKYLKSVKTKITINVLANESDFLQYSDISPVVKVLDEYPKYNSNVTVRYVDLDKNPSFQTNYPNAQLSQYGFLVTAGSRYKFISINDMIQTTTDSSTGQSVLTGYDTENQIDSAMLYVTTNNLPTVVFTSGHNEQDSSSLQSLLTKNNYQIQTANLMTGSIDKNASALAIVAPSKDFSSDEITKIDNFLSNGGAQGKNLIVLFDPQQTKLPNLEDYLSEWGIGVGTGVIYDTTNSVNNDEFEVLNGTIDSTTFSSIGSNTYADLYDSRPLNLLFTTKSVYTTTDLVQTQGTSKLFNPPQGISSSTTFDPSSADRAKDQAGPFTVMAKSAKTVTYKNNTATSTVMVSGSTQMLNSTLLSQPNLTNSDILSKAINGLVGFKAPLTISSKSANTTQLNIPASQQKLIEALFLVIIPLLVLVAGLVVWFRRRHL